MKEHGDAGRATRCCAARCRRTWLEADRPGSDKTVPLDHNEVFGPVQPANLMVIADHFTERAGGRPHTDVRLANLRLSWLLQVTDPDVVPDATDTGELRDHHFCRFPLGAAQGERGVSRHPAAWTYCG